MAVSFVPFKFDLPPSRLFLCNGIKGLGILNNSLQQCSIVGIDTETQPSFKARIATKPTALLQIALKSENDETVFIVDMLEISKSYLKLNQLDDILLKCFKNQNIVKLGHGLHNDFCQMSKAYKSMKAFNEINSMLETNDLYRYMYPEIKQDASLKFFVEKYLDYSLNKSQQLSNWAARPLSINQIHYAACDALVLIRLYDKMCRSAECYAGSKNALFEVSNLFRKFSSTISKTKNLTININSNINTNMTSNITTVIERKKAEQQSNTLLSATHIKFTINNKISSQVNDSIKIKHSKATVDSEINSVETSFECNFSDGTKNLEVKNDNNFNKISRKTFIGKKILTANKNKKQTIVERKNKRKIVASHDAIKKYKYYLV